MKKIPPPPTMFALLSAAHALEARLEESLEQVGLSGAKFAALTKLIEAGEPLSLGVLAERLTCVRSNITQLVDRLEADGLVRRVDDPADRRGKQAAITELGRKRQTAGAKRVEEVEAGFSRSLSTVEAANLASVLAALK